MAIKFGDILQNQNAAYPIVEASNNDVKGLIFSTGLPGANDFPNKRALGTILVDTTQEKMYFYKGNDITNASWSTSNNWELLATGSGETIQTTDLPVSIPTGRSFGRFVNGDTIDVGESGETAMQIIIDAITSFQPPTGAFDSATQTAIDYDTTSQSNISRTITFTVTNENQQVISGNAFKIAKVRLLRKYATGNYSPIASTVGTDSLPFTTNAMAAINTQGAVAAGTFTFEDTLSTSGSDNQHFVYKIEITPNDAGGSATTAVEIEGTNSDNGFVDVLPYDQPKIVLVTVERQDVSTHFKTTGSGNNGQETDVRRPKGNIASKITFTLDNDSPLVPITGFSLQRKIDNGSFVEIFSQTGLSIVGTTNGERKIFDSIQTSGNNITGLNGVVTGFTDVTTAFPPSSTDADTIRYQIVITDDQQNTTIAVGSEINFEFPGMIGFGTTDGSEFTSSNNATMTNLLEAIRDSSALQAQYEIISIADNQAVDPDFGVVPINSNSSQFVYIGFPAALNEIDTVLDPNNANAYTTFGSDPKSINVQFTTHYGVQGTYEFYCSNGAGSFTGNHTIN